MRGKETGWGTGWCRQASPWRRLQVEVGRAEGVQNGEPRAEAGTAGGERLPRLTWAPAWLSAIRAAGPEVGPLKASLLLLLVPLRAQAER